MNSVETPLFGNILVDPAWKIAIIRSAWYPEMMTSLVQDATEALRSAGIQEENILFLEAPGSYELPLVAQTALEAGADGVIAFGIIVQGSTHHARLIAEQSAAGCMRVQLDQKKPVIYEVLFVDNLEDAKERSIGPKAKGGLAARTLLSQLAGLAKLH